MEKFIQISNKSGFMKHNSGLLFRKFSKKKFQFKTKIKRNHLNRAGITHGGYIASIIDSGAGAAVHKMTHGKVCVTISLDIKFIGTSKLSDEILGHVLIQKVTKSLIFVTCYLECQKKLIASASGIWKKMNYNF